MKIFSTDANNAYPDHKLPTVLLYHKGKIAESFFGLDTWGGPGVTERGEDLLIEKASVLEASVPVTDVESGGR